MLILLLFLFYISRDFYLLAKEFGKSKWLFTIIGAFVFYIGMSIGQFLVMFATIQVSGINPITNIFSVFPSLITSAIGLGISTLIYKFFMKRWKEEGARISNTEILDDGLYE